MRMTPGKIAAVMEAEIVAEGGEGAPLRATIDSAATGPGDLFFGLRGKRVDGAEFAPAAIEAGAWGVVVGKPLTSPLLPNSGNKGEVSGRGGWVFAVPDPLASLQALALDWRRALGARTVGITGSVGKTSVKDIARAAVRPGARQPREPQYRDRPAADDPRGAGGHGDPRAGDGDAGAGSDRRAGGDRRARVRGDHQRRLGARRAAGSVEAIAAAKAEVLAALPDDGVAIVPVEAGALEPHLSAAPGLLRFGAGGDLSAVESRVVDGVTEALIETPAGRRRFDFPFAEAHNLENALAAVAVGVALGAPLAEMADRVANIGFSRFRGERLELGDGIVLVNDCYNANPVSMRAALGHLASIGADELVATPEEAAELLAAQLEPGDTVLVKGSRSAGLEAVAETLRELVDG